MMLTGPGWVGGGGGGGGGWGEGGGHFRQGGEGEQSW